MTQNGIWLKKGLVPYHLNASELALALGLDMAVNRLTRHLNVNAGRLLEEYNVKYESLARHDGRRIRLTGAVVVGEAESATLATVATIAQRNTNLTVATVATVAENKISVCKDAPSKNLPTARPGGFEFSGLGMQFQQGVF